MEGLRAQWVAGPGSDCPKVGWGQHGLSMVRGRLVAQVWGGLAVCVVGSYSELEPGPPKVGGPTVPGGISDPWPCPTQSLYFISPGSLSEYPRQSELDQAESEATSPARSPTRVAGTQAPAALQGVH